MKRTLLMGVVVGLGLAAANVASAAGMYLSGKFGAFFPNNDTDGLRYFKTGLSGELAFGVKPIPYLAIEAGVGYYEPKDAKRTFDEYNSSSDWSFEKDTINIDVLPVTMTLKGILPLFKNRVEMFVGGGAGYYKASGQAKYYYTDSQGNSDSGRSTFEGDGVGFHLVTGANYRFVRHFSLGVEAKWSTARVNLSKNIGKTEVGGTTVNLVASYLF